MKEIDSINDAAVGQEVTITFKGKVRLDGHSLKRGVEIGQNLYLWDNGMAMCAAHSIEVEEPEWHAGDVVLVRHNRYINDNEAEVVQRDSTGTWRSTYGSPLPETLLNKRYNEGNVTLIMRDGKVVPQDGAE